MKSVPTMVDLAYTPKEAKEEAASVPMDSISGPKYPWGLRISLDTDTLEKLGLEASDVQVGDIVHIFAFAEVVSISMSDNADGGKRSCVDLQITQMASEDEDDENEAADKTEDRKPRTIALYS